MSLFGSDELTPGIVHARAAHTTGLITGTGGRFVAGLAIVTIRVVLAALPHMSVRVSVTV